MQIRARAARDDFTAGDAAQAVGEGAGALGDHASVGDGDDIAFQFAAMRLQKRFEVRAADFFLAFEEADEVDRQ